MDFPEASNMKAPREINIPFAPFLSRPCKTQNIQPTKKEGIMFHHRYWITLTIVIFGLAMFVPVAQAQRQDFETRQCNVQIFNPVHSTPELGFASYDQKGILQSTHESKLFDNWTLHLVAVVKRVGDKASWNGFSKEMAPDGEFIIWEFYGDSESRTTIAKPIYGTGKWKDVKGERKSQVITSGKPIIPNSTIAMCQKQVGWIELPK